MNAGTGDNVDPAQTERFTQLAESWWDAEGPSRALHQMNPVRLRYIAGHAPLAEREVLDVGCGAGLLSESMAGAGARVTGIDAAPAMIRAAREHAKGGRTGDGLDISYHTADAESWCTEHAARYDVVTCMELIEHVPQPDSLVRACVALLRPGGQLFLSTINRTPRAWLLAVVAAEYVLGLLPRGTHDYERLVRPSELDAWLRAGGATLHDLRGLAYNPLSGRFGVSSDVSVNYIVAARRDYP